MKRTAIFVLVLMLCLVLCACKSEAVTAAEELIAGIGTVGLDSGDAIAAAQAAFDALPEEEKNQVENAAQLLQAAAAHAQLLLRDMADGVQAQIDALGEITLERETAVTEVQAAFDALPEEAKSLVGNAEVLQQAVQTVKKLRLEEKLLGTWYVETTRYDDSKEGSNKYQQAALMGTNHNTVGKTFSYTHPEHGDRRLAGDFFHISAAGFYSGSSETVSHILGQWHLTDDLTALVVDLEVQGLPVDQYVFDIREEDGFTKLYGDYPYENALAFVHESDVQGAFDAKYYFFEMKKDDIQDFFGDPVDLGYLYDENGDRIKALYENGQKVADLENVWLFPSKAYENGLVFVDGTFLNCSMTFKGHSGNVNTNNPVLVTGSVYSDMKLTAGNKLLFVRSDHVAKNYIDEMGCRTLELTDGSVIRCAADDYFDEVNYIWKYLKVDYNDYLY